MRKLIEILEREIEALWRDFARPGISELERTRIMATIDNNMSQIAELKKKERDSQPVPKTSLDSDELFEPYSWSKGPATTDRLPPTVPVTVNDQNGKMWAF